jgi:S-DNA-T family DNA segregation ATPase FtsK/SpoIIIE
LWIGFEALNKQKPLGWPLAKAGKASLFEPVPFGASQRGNIIHITLMFASILIGAMPRMGKTFALRVLALGAALDPTARLRIWELKGTGDLAALRHVAHEYGSGADEETLDGCLASVRALHRQLDIRAKTLRELPDSVRPENKVTPQLCARRGLGLFPEVLIVDECQEAFSDEDRKAEFEKLTTAIIKRGPALGIMLILATQRPDASSLPKGISANIGIRYCLRMMGTYENNAVLGPGMYARGIRATDFALSDKGIGWLAGHADDPQIVRGCYIDAPAADTIARRARAAREAAGTLSGYALGEDTAVPARDFLADVLSVFGDGEANLWAETIAVRLTDQIPDAYDLLTKDAVGSQLRAAGVDVRPVRETGQGTRSGCARADVEACHA